MRSTETGGPALQTGEANAGAAGGDQADVCVIANADSGRRDGRAKLDALEAAFAAYPGRFELRLVRSGEGIEPAARRAVEEGFRTVAAAGGDGTICAVAAAVLGSQARLGVLPLGTFNYFARSIGTPVDLAAAAQALAEGAERRVHVGTANGRAFLNNASLGLYPTILRRREKLYDRWGRSRIAAYWSLITTILNFRSPLALRVSVDGEVRRVRTPMVFVASNPRQLEEIGLGGADVVRDGQFALFIAPDCAGFALLRYLVRLASRTMQPGRDFDLLHGREIVAETRRRRMPVARDGEREMMTAPFRFEMRPNALTVLVPAPAG